MQQLPKQDSEQTTINSTSRDRELPLSFAQERLWFIDQFINQLEGQSLVYNIQRIFQLQGILNTATLQQAIICLIERHEILRSNFLTNNQGNPFVAIHPQVNFSLPIINLETLLEKEQKLELKKIIEQESLRRLDLRTDSLIHFQLIKLASEDHILIITIHHIIADGWSMNILSQELSQLYNIFCQNHHSSSLSPLPIQYVDFAVWQREWLTGEVLAHQLDYWREQLKGIPSLIELPKDRPRPPMETFRGRVAKFTLNRILTDKLNTLSQKAGVTLFMTLFTVFSSLLHRN